MDAHTVGPTPTQAHAFLGVNSAFHTFRFNPDTVNWNYQENTVSRDTIGGRVVQLLSVQIQGLSVEGRAGSRGELQRLADNVRDIMGYHVKTSRPVQFRVPSRRWNFNVYVQAMPQIGWDVAATSYPYSLQLAVVDDLTGVQSRKLQGAALERLSEGIGYIPAFSGGNATEFKKIVDAALAGRMGSGEATSDSTTTGTDSGIPLADDEVSRIVLKSAEDQMGVPYSWGTNNPLGPEGGPGANFDCSGLTQHAYGDAHVVLPHNAAAQASLCKQRNVYITNRENLAPGDLVFFGASIHHVGIYWGSGKMINAPHTGANVRIDTLFSDYVGGGRPR